MSVNEGVARPPPARGARRRPRAAPPSFRDTPPLPPPPPPPLRRPRPAPPRGGPRAVWRAEKCAAARTRDRTITVTATPPAGAITFHAFCPHTSRRHAKDTAPYEGDARPSNAIGRPGHRLGVAATPNAARSPSRSRAGQWQGAPTPPPLPRISSRGGGFTRGLRGQGCVGLPRSAPGCPGLRSGKTTYGHTIP